MIKPGTVREDLVSFIDFAPTMLALAGAAIPTNMPYAQRIDYMEMMPTMKTWRRLNYEGKLNGPQKLFFQLTKPAEELYDTEADPHEINNLAGDSKSAPVLTEMRAALDQWMTETRDLGAISEEEMIRRRIVADKLEEYAKRVQPLEVPLQPKR